MSILNKWMDKRIAAWQSDLIRTHYAEVENMMREMRVWRHDYKNHLQTMKSYAAQGDLASIRRYLNELDSDLARVTPVLKTGNPMADAILNSKISLAKSRDIAVEADVHVPVALTTPEIELCAVLGNLFDNAIDASMALPAGQRRIRIYMDMKGTRLYICFTNLTAAPKQKKLGGRFASMKGAGHGFGLVRIDDIVRRHGGWLDRNSEDGAFTTEILLPQ